MISEQKLSVDYEFPKDEELINVYNRKEIADLFKKNNLQLNENWHPDLGHLGYLNAKVFSEMIIPRDFIINYSAYKNIYQEVISKLPTNQREYAEYMIGMKGVDVEGGIDKIRIHAELIDMKIETKEEYLQDMHEMVKNYKTEDLSVLTQKSKQLQGVLKTIAYNVMGRYGKVFHLGPEHQESMNTSWPVNFIHVIGPENGVVPFTIDFIGKQDLFLEIVHIHPDHWKIYLDELRKRLE